jgi:hypothetical protein
MKIGSYHINVEGTKGRYECAVEEVHDNGETFYHVDIMAPYGMPGTEAPTPMKFNVEMHFDSEVGGLKINGLARSLPGDLLEIEERLSDQIYGIHN